ncbi:MAG TPA: iron-sulfur cluster loop [bacterium]|nr:iron-sulfur cluster loop [bacterium]
MTNRGYIVQSLVRSGTEMLRAPRGSIKFSPKPRVNEVLNNIETYPHLFVLGIQMDRGIESALAWEVPFRVSEELGLKSYEFAEFCKPSIEDLVKVFIGTGLHRYPAKMARIFFNTLEHIAQDYDGDARRIWNDKPSSATLIKRFLQFDGMALRMAGRAANSLYRDFKVELSDATSLDISPEYFVRRVFQRTGFISRHSSDEELIYLARELHLKYPGVFDKPCQEIARTVCWKEKPQCRECQLNRACLKIF